MLSSRKHSTREKNAARVVSFRQRAVIEFLVKEETPAAEIRRRLQRVYDNVCMGASSVRRWVKNFKDGNTLQICPIAVALKRPLLNTTKKGLMRSSETTDV